MSAFLGMIGNGDWADNQRPKDYRQLILHEFPNGDAPITAITSMMKNEKTTSAEFNWWTKRLPSQSGAVSGIYIDAGLSTAYVYATHQSTFGVSGKVVYAKVAEALAKEIVPGHQVVLRDDDVFDVDVVGEVVGVNYNGSSSYIAVELLEDDDNSASSSSYNLSTVDRLIVVGNINAEGGMIPRGLAYTPVQYTNYTQIFRTAMEIARTARREKLRTGDQFVELKREALERHSIELEKALIWSVRSETIGSNGKPKRTFDGMLSFIRRNATSTSLTAQSSINDFRLNTNYSGQSWLDGGEHWFDSMLEYLGTYAPNEVIGLCGSGALTGIARLAKVNGNIQLQPGPNKTYGMSFTTWVNPHITVHLKKHPLMARESSTKYSMLLFSPKNIVMRVLENTKFLKNRQAPGIDGEVHEFLTEIGPEFHFPDQFQWLNGIGCDNTT